MLKQATDLGGNTVVIAPLGRMRSDLIRSKLLLKWLRSSVPGFAQAWDWFGGQIPTVFVQARRLEIGRRFQDGLPQSLEESVSGPAAYLVLLHQSKDALVQLVHNRIGVLPGVAEGRMIEGSHHALNLGKLQQARAGRDEQANSILDRGHVADEIQFADDVTASRDSRPGWSRA